MELLIIIILLLILVETSFLTVKKLRPLRTGKRKIYIDTSVLIDGRVINIAKSGFLDGDLIILKSVLKELQLLADGKDSEKRQRARAGLNTVSELERVINVNTEIFDDGDGRKKVDDELLKIAKENHGEIMTMDYNLIKVAEAEKIGTLNINNLALAVRTEFLPGEKLRVKIVEKGSNRGQGIAHLPDGTMVVVERAANKIGEILNIELVKFHETSAGKMMFAKIVR